MPSFKNGVLLLYNFSLFVSHAVIFVDVLHSGVKERLKDFEYGKLFPLLVIITAIQYLDIILFLLSFTKSNPIAVFTQVTGRIFVLYVATHVVGWTLAVYSLVFVYILSELCRGPYYITNCLGEPSPVLAFLRYNAFKLLYPIGFMCEALVFANVYYQSYKKGAFISSTGTDYSPYIAISFLIFFGFIVRFLFGTMSRQAASKRKLWEEESKSE